MTKIISREKAFEEINKVLPKDECLVCWLHKNAEYVLDKGKFSTTILSKYPRNWGHTMVLLNSHKTSISEITKEEWSELLEQTRIAAAAIEKKLTPLRCYIASLGATENLPNTCPHIHFNIIPIYNVNDKPATVLTWEHGVVTGDEKEWEELFNQLKILC
jgi:diadenosine tetraphosphate (Ap4A) HIT family hydrolase